MGLTAPKMETQEVCPGGSCHLIYLGILAYTILKIVFSAFLSFLLITGWFKLVPTEGEMHTHTTTSNLNTSDLSCAVKTKTHFKTQTWSCYPAAPNPSQALLRLNCIPLSTSYIEALSPNMIRWYLEMELWEGAWV